MKMPAETGISLFERPIILLAGYHRNLKKRTAQWFLCHVEEPLGVGLYGNWACAFTLQKLTKKNAAHILQ
jgi:hypothetical protein